jgi:hypothetical protein
MKDEEGKVQRVKTVKCEGRVSGGLATFWHLSLSESILGTCQFEKFGCLLTIS